MTDLETRLRRAGEDLRLDRPVADVIARGTAVRRRRRVAQVAVVGSAVVAAAAVAIPVLAAFTAGDDGSTAAVSPPMVRLSPAVVAAADEKCRAGVPATILDKTAGVFGADRHGNDTVLLYRTPGAGTAYGICGLGAGGIGWSGDLSRAGNLEAPTDQRPLVIDDARLIDASGDGAGILLDVGRAGPTVTRVVAQVGSDTIGASIDRGWYWFSTATERAAGDDSTPRIQIRAYDASGALVDELTVPETVSVTDPDTGR